MVCQPAICATASPPAHAFDCPARRLTAPYFPCCFCVLIGWQSNGGQKNAFSVLMAATGKKAADDTVTKSKQSVKAKDICLAPGQLVWLLGILCVKRAGFGVLYFIACSRALFEMFSFANFTQKLQINRPTTNASANPVSDAFLSDNVAIAAVDQTNLSLCRDPSDTALTFEERSRRAMILRQQFINAAAVELLSERAHGTHRAWSETWICRLTHLTIVWHVALLLWVVSSEQVPFRRHCCVVWLNLALAPITCTFTVRRHAHFTRLLIRLLEVRIILRPGNFICEFCCCSGMGFGPTWMSYRAFRLPYPLTRPWRNHPRLQTSQRPPHPPRSCPWCLPTKKFQLMTLPRTKKLGQRGITLTLGAC
jgi:hypothetical protein